MTFPLKMDELLALPEREICARFVPDNHLEDYFALLAKENQRINLVSRETLPPSSGAGERLPGFDGLYHLAAESLIPLCEIPAATAKERLSIRRCLDVGSGGGFPAIPIALALKPESLTLIERRQKKSAALRRMMLSLAIPGEPFPESFENARLPHADFDLITLRLVNLNPQMLDQILSLLAPEGHFIYYNTFDHELQRDDINIKLLSFCLRNAKYPTNATVVWRKL